MAIDDPEGAPVPVAGRLSIVQSRAAPRFGAWLYRAAVLIGGLVPAAAFAQGAPPTRTDGDVNNPRALQRFEATERERALRDAATPTVAGADKQQEQATVPEGAEKVTFLLKDISFGQSKVFQPAELDAFAKPYRGRTISVADLFRITAEINDAYRERGYITGQAILGPQKIADGTVRIDLVEGTIGEVIVARNQRVGSAFIVDRIRIEPGTIPTIELLERRVSAINSNHNFQVTAALKPGAAPLTTDLLVDVSSERKPITGSVYVDNNGTRSSGLYSLGGLLSFYSFLGYDELLSVGATTSFTETDDALRDFSVGSAFVDALLPLPKSNGSFRVLYSHSNSAVLEGDFASLGIDGRGDVVSSTLTQPFFTDAVYNFSVVTGHQYSSTRSTVGIVDTDTRAQRLFLGVSGQMADAVSGMFIEGELRVVQSWVDVWGLSGREDESVTRLVGDASVYKQYENGISLRSRLAGQYTPEDRLPTGELWYMGGAGTLPAYELSSISGDTGFVLSNQARYTSAAVNEALSDAITVPITVGARTFFDVGGAFDDFDLDRDSDLYADYGLGLDFNVGNHLSADFAVAWPVDRDSDPTLTVQNPRFLFSVASTF